jgi:hypothetical protein
MYILNYLILINIIKDQKNIKPLQTETMYLGLTHKIEGQERRVGLQGRTRAPDPTFSP